MSTVSARTESEMTMALEIAQLGQPVLREVAEQVPPEQIADPQFQQFLREMAETLEEKKGAGLAAPQVFAGPRVFLAAILPAQEEDGPPGVEVFINPTITPLTQDTARAWEGCLSFPELLVLVPRYRAVQIDYLNAAGEPRTLALVDFPARVVQHEFDHLEGVLTIDRAESSLHIVKASEIDAVREAMGEMDDEEE
jgi:peptide deformylase